MQGLLCTVVSLDGPKLSKGKASALTLSAWRALWFGSRSIGR